MAIISNINPERIQWCCQQALHDMVEFATKKKIPLEKLRNGRLTYNQLKKVADFFGYTPLFYLESSPPAEEKIHTATFRSLAGQSVKMDYKLVRIIKQVEWYRDLYLSLMEDLDEEREFFDPPALTGTIAEKSSAVRQWLGLGDNDSEERDYDYYRDIIEAKGILVFQSMGYNGAWKLLKDSKAIGFSIPHPQVPSIFIKKASRERMSFTLFHELGHILLHDTSCMDDETQLRRDHPKKREQEANQFAAKCLLPPSELSDSVTVGPEGYDHEFGSIADRLGISVEVVVVAYLQKGLISGGDYSVYKGIKEQQKAEWEGEITEKFSAPRMFRHREPLHIFGRNYVGTVLDAFHSGVVTLSKTSKYLDGIKVSDIKKLQGSL